MTSMQPSAKSASKPGIAPDGSAEVWLVSVPVVAEGCAMGTDEASGEEEVGVALDDTVLVGVGPARRVVG